MAKRTYSTPPEGAQRVFGCARVSTDQQRNSGLSIDEQRVKIAARCTEHGWQLEHVYVDAGVSGSMSLSNRPEGSRLLAALRPGDTVIAARMDRCFRPAIDALQVIDGFKRRRISFWLLDLGGDVSGNGISELIVTILASVAQFERTLISERICDAKRQLRRQGKHQGGTRPFGYQLGELGGHGQSRALIPDPGEQAAIADIVRMRCQGLSLMAIRDAVGARGFKISHQTVANLARRALEAAA